MRNLLGWQVFVSLILLGTFIPVFTLAGGWEAQGDARISVVVLAFLAVATVAYILNAQSKMRLVSLVTGFGAAAFGLFALLDGWMSVILGLFIPAVVAGLVWDDIRRGETFERPLKPFWTGFSLFVQFTVVAGTLMAVTYNLPGVLLVWLLVPAAFLGWLLIVYAPRLWQ